MGSRVTLRHARESTLETRLAQNAHAWLGVDSVKLSLHLDAGWPDRIFLTPGDPFFMELKRAGSEGPTPLQRHRMATLEALGYDVAWFDDYDAAMTAIRERVKHAKT